jgi:fibronectin-binding autotransporter adhesin
MTSWCLSTIFSGVIQDGGSVTKIGAGTLTLTGANIYTGGTTIEGGQFAVNNRTGSGTGTGTVKVNAGTLSGRGTIAGAVIVGTGSGSGAFLIPGAKKLGLSLFKAGSSSKGMGPTPIR